MNSVIILLLLVGAYLVGALPSGYWIAQIAGIDDIRKYGSGNIGATNVARLLGLRYFFIVLLADGLKAFIYLCMARLSLNEPYLTACALCLLIGNGYSIFLRGQGGKGVSTVVGILLALHPTLFFSMMLTWVIALFFSRVIGIASVVSLCMLPCVALLISDVYGLVLVLFLAAWIVWRHKENIRSFYYAR